LTLHILIIVGITMVGMAVSFVLGYYHGYTIATTKEDV